MEQFLKRSSATGILSCISRDYEGIYGGSIWAMRGTEIRSVSATLLEDYESLVIDPQALPTASMDSVACSSAVGVIVTFENYSYASHNMHGNVEFYHTALVDFDASRKLRITVAKGEIIYAVDVLLKAVFSLRKSDVFPPSEIVV